MGVNIARDCTRVRLEASTAIRSPEKLERALERRWRIMYDFKHYLRANFLLLFRLAHWMNRNWFWSKPEIKRLERICTASEASCAQVSFDSNDLGLGSARSDAFSVIKRDWNRRVASLSAFSLKILVNLLVIHVVGHFPTFSPFYQPRATPCKLILINRLHGEAQDRRNFFDPTISPLRRTWTLGPNFLIPKCEHLRELPQKNFLLWNSPSVCFNL